MPPTTTPTNPDADIIEITDRNGQKYATDTTTGDGCHGKTRAEVLHNLSVKLERKTHRNPADPHDIEALLNTE